MRAYLIADMEQSSFPARVPLVTEPMTLLQSLTAARRNVLSIIPDIATRQPMVSGKTGKRWHMVMDPDALRRMLLEKVDDYPKSLVTKNLLKPAIGESLFIAEGAHWRWQRRAAAPVFSHRNVLNLSPIMSDAALRIRGLIATRCITQSMLMWPRPAKCHLAISLACRIGCHAGAGSFRANPCAK